MKTESYVLITPAKNEGKYIGALIESVLSQTILPLRWFIIDDASTDETGAILARYASQHAFIVPLRAEGSNVRSFGSKVSAFSYGYEQAKLLDFEFLGNLDADVTLPSNYYERMLHEMKANLKLGIAGGIIFERSMRDTWQDVSSPDLVAGALQFFRRPCYEEIGGIRPVSIAGEDSLAEIKARMKGWEVRAFSDLAVRHHKPMGSASGGRAKIHFRLGQTDYHLGKHPLYILLKAVRRMVARPYLIGSVMLVIGYFRLWVTASRRDATPDVVRFVQDEEMAKIKTLLLLRSYRR